MQNGKNVHVRPCFLVALEGSEKEWFGYGMTVEKAVNNLKSRMSYGNRPDLIADLRVPESADGVTAAERALKFLSSLDMIDHSIQEQRECVEVVHLLIKALQPEKFGV